MKRTFLYSVTALVFGLIHGATVAVAQQPPPKDTLPKDTLPKASNAPADRFPRDNDDPNSFAPRDGRQRPPGEPGRAPRPGAPYGREGLRPEGFPGGNAFPGGVPNNMQLPGPGQPFDPYRGPGGQDRLEDLKKYDPEMYELEKKDMELEQQSLDLSQQYRRAPRDQRETLKGQLQEVVQKQFDARQARRQLQLKRLEEELAKMRSAIERRTESRVQIVERRIAELVGERGDLDF